MTAPEIRTSLHARIDELNENQLKALRRFMNEEFSDQEKSANPSKEDDPLARAWYVRQREAYIQGGIKALDRLLSNASESQTFWPSFVGEQYQLQKDILAMRGNKGLTEHLKRNRVIPAF